MDDSSPDTNTIVDMEGNKDAERALFRVKQKLDGYEEGEMRSLQGQVGSGQKIYLSMAHACKS